MLSAMGRFLYRSQPLAPDAPTIVQNAAPALARVAREKSVLAFPAHFRWLILSFHKSV
jgi:hypothetical protein